MPYVQANTGADAPTPPSQMAPQPYFADPRYHGGRRGRGVLVAIVLGVVAVLVAVAALVVALTGVGREPAPATPAAAPAAPSQVASTADADRGLCTSIAPLMAESDKTGNAFVGLGPTGTPARDAALPKFVADTEDWARRTQGVLDAHPDAQPFLRRTLQRYIDDMTLYAKNIRPGPQTTYDTAAWADSLVAYGGPLTTCQDLGIKW
jgi:hypothetical protein